MASSLGPGSKIGWIALAAIVVALDQLTKYMASVNLELHQPVEVIPSLNLTLLHNSGAAFSLLNQAGGWQRWLFVGLAGVISGILLVWLYRLPRDKLWLSCALALVLGGALGNLWDRISLGYVIDFIDVYYERWHWPAFNIADSAICVGAAMMIFDVFNQPAIKKAN